jgi:hypothetical protein
LRHHRGAPEAREQAQFAGPLLVEAHDPDGGQAAVLLEGAP